MIEFIVDTAKKCDTYLSVTGIIEEGTIKIGDHFNILCQDWIQGNEFARSEIIDLTIVKIIAYRHEFDELERGISAELQLVGDHDIEFTYMATLVGDSEEPKK